MTLGVLFALIAGLMWGLVFMAPVWLPDYPPALLAVGRYLAFGLIALPLAWFDRARLARLSRRDWHQAFMLALIGNLLYYTCLAAAIQHAGVPLPTMIIGTLPVVIAVSANIMLGLGERLAWRRLLAALLLIAAGLVLVNHAELAHLQASSPSGSERGDLQRYGAGALLAVGALVCWTIYPIVNARWLRAHPGRSASTWATAQGVATLPLALIGYGLLWSYFAIDQRVFAMPLGPAPQRFVLLMLTLGLLASWLGTWCWNEASQRLPTALVGQLIVFETLAALAYALMWRGDVPSMTTLVGAALLVAGVSWALRGSRNAPVDPSAH